MKRVAVFLILALAAGALALYLRSQEPPEIRTAVANRQRIEVTINTNGKIEPVTWGTVRAERAGLITGVPVTRGEKLRKGQTIAQMESREERTALDQARARVEQAKAELETLSRGGRSPEVAALDAELAQVKLNRAQGQRDLEVTIRLEARKAATRQEVQDGQDRLARFDEQIRTLAARRAALVNPPDLKAAQGRLADAEAAVRLAEQRLALGVLKAPLDGTLYQLSVRPGTYVEPGEEIAVLGSTDRLRVVVFVDEPELGRVRAGMPVVITWDAVAARRWTGRVEKIPTQIVPLGTRQVGEVLCQIENPDGLLLPGTNVNVALQSDVAESAVAIPKEALQRREGRTGVYVLDGERLAWRPVDMGIASVTAVEIRSGVKEGERIALPAPFPLSDGLAVRALTR